MTTPPDPPRAKQVIVIRRELQMRRGKEIAQGSHASMEWLTSQIKDPDDDTGDYSYYQVAVSNPQLEWLLTGRRKIVCQVRTEDQLMEVYDRAQAAGLTVHLITDAGYTEFGNQPTKTAIAIGPDYDENIDPVTGDLELY
jgi:peptidyl-tRNA hydrolase, PTH2 family